MNNIKRSIIITSFIILLIISTFIVINLENVNKKEYHFFGPEGNGFSHLRIIDSKIIGKDIHKFTIKVLKGFGTYENEYTRLEQKKIIIHHRLFDNSRWPIPSSKNINISVVGDHLSVYFSSGFERETVLEKVFFWDDTGFYFNYVHSLDHLNISNLNGLEISRNDIFKSNIDVDLNSVYNVTHLTNYYNFLYWSPINGTMMPITPEELEMNGLIIVNQSSFRNFYYESHLNVSYNGKRYYLTDDEYIRLIIDEHEYLFSVYRMFRQTLFESIMVSGIYSPGIICSMSIERLT